MSSCPACDDEASSLLNPLTCQCPRQPQISGLSRSSDRIHFAAPAMMWPWCAADRRNIDFRCMLRGVPELSEPSLQLRKDVSEVAAVLHVPCEYLNKPLLRSFAYSMITLHVAAHSCDYYITKYQAKPMEQLQNVVTQFALGIRRLELEEAESTPNGLAGFVSAWPLLQTDVLGYLQQSLPLLS